MSVMDDILKLAALTGVDPGAISHFVTGVDGAIPIVITVPVGRCIVITQVGQAGVDTSAANTVQASYNGQPQTNAAQAVDIAFTGDLLYAFHSGKIVLTLATTSAPTKTARTRVVYYELPESALELLQICGTRQVMQ